MNINKENRKEINCKKIINVVVPFFAAGVFTALVGCPFRTFLGISCPGCGLTRAHLAALRLQFSAALYYHPLFWTVIPLVLFFGFKKTPLGRRDKICIGLIAIGFLAIYIIRVFILHTEFLQFDLKGSFISEIIKRFGGIHSGE